MYDALGSSLRGQMRREMRPPFGSFNAALTSASVAGVAPEICACAQVVVSSRFGSSLTGTAGDEELEERQRGAARREGDAGLHFDAYKTEPRPQRGGVGHGGREHPWKVGRRELDCREVVRFEGDGAGLGLHAHNRARVYAGDLTRSEQPYGHGRRRSGVDCQRDVEIDEVLGRRRRRQRREASADPRQKSIDGRISHWSPRRAPRPVVRRVGSGCRQRHR